MLPSKKQTTQSELARSLFLVTAASVFGKVFFVIIGSAAYTGFLYKLGINDFVFGVIMAIPVIGNVFQIAASYILENSGKRKRIFLVSAYIHRLAWIPIALIPLLFSSGNNAFIVWTVAILVFIHSTGLSVAGISYSSWMGDLVPTDIKGRFFSKRIALATVTGALTAVLSGLVLDQYKSGFAGFAIVFTAAALFGAADASFFIGVKDPPMHHISEEKSSFKKMLSETFQNKNYMKLILFVAIWNFGFNFAEPFTNKYMINYLHMSYFSILIFSQLIGNLATVLSINLLGRLADKFGGKPVTAICCFFVMTLPVLWCFATPGNYYFIVFLINFLSGVFQAGFLMTSVNLSIWMAPGKNRSMYIANYTLITSIAGTSVAYILGGSFMEFTNQWISNLHITLFAGQQFSNYHALFILSSLLRLSALMIFLPMIREENSTTVVNMIKRSLEHLKLKKSVS